MRGQWVRVKLPGTKVIKGGLRYSYPQMIDEVSEDGSAIRLTNGQWWNMGRVVKVDPPCRSELSMNENTNPGKMVPSNLARCDMNGLPEVVPKCPSSRECLEHPMNLPLRFRDYLMC